MADYDAADALFWRDEILQIMYWLRGEGLGEVVDAKLLVTFLQTEVSRVQFYLERLAADGYTDCVGGARYTLTELGVSEGGRRFADAFDGLTKQAHGVCNNPRCACQTLGPAACTAGAAHSH